MSSDIELRAVVDSGRSAHYFEVNVLAYMIRGRWIWNSLSASFKS